MSLYAYCMRRCLQAVLIFFGVLSVLFILFHIVGGDPALMYAGKNADARTIELLRHQMGLDRGIFIQYCIFLKHAVLFDWGTSWVSQRPVLTLIAEGLGPSVSVTFTGFALSLVLALALAYVSVHFRGRWIENGLNAIVALLMSVSFIVVILFMQKLFAYNLDWFPVYGWDSGWAQWQYVALPCLIFMVSTFASKFLVFREMIAEEMEKRYVTTARSKGVSQRAIYLRHIFRNLLPTLVTLISAQVPALITGSLLIELYFGIPGVGYLLLKSIQSSDFPTVKALTLFGSLVYIVSVFIGDLVAHIALPTREDL